MRKKGLKGLGGSLTFDVAFHKTHSETGCNERMAIAAKADSGR